MPLHDWTGDDRWYAVRHLWMVELVRSLKPRLPEGYRVYLGSLPVLTARSDRPIDRTEHPLLPPPGSPTGEAEPDPIPPDFEGPVRVLHPVFPSVLIGYHGQLTAVVEVVSPEYRAERDAALAFTDKYLGYLRQAVNLMIVDVALPLGTTLGDGVARKLISPAPRLDPGPSVVSFRVDARSWKESPAVATWRRPVPVGQPLPALPLAINPQQTVPVDLEATYMRAAADAYLA